MAHIEIKIYSVTSCPWCYIGEETFDRAITLFQKTYPSGSSDTFTIKWLPFYLDPSAPAKGFSMHERMIQRVGLDRVQGIQARLKRVGQASGTDFNFAGKTGNTRDSHLLIQLAGTKGPIAQKTLVDEIFASHFERGGDITNRDEFIRAGVVSGLDESEMRACLQDEEMGREIDRQAEEARASGVSSVPTFETRGRRIEGADDPSVFYEAFILARGG